MVINYFYVLSQLWFHYFPHTDKEASLTVSRQLYAITINLFICTAIDRICYVYITYMQVSNPKNFYYFYLIYVYIETLRIMTKLK